MALKHSVYDSDTHFSINPITRAIKNESTTKTGLVQYDHNSERFTFEIPKLIEGHDMSKCDVIEVHYINIGSQTGEESKDVYTVTDMQVSKEDPNVVIFSWLLSQNATRYVGSLNFLVRFACMSEITPSKVVYAWHTAVHSNISVSSGIQNKAVILDDFSDTLETWRKELFAFKFVDLEQVVTSDVSGGENVWRATFSDGSKRDLTVTNGIGISSVEQTTESNESEGENKVTITLSNGKKEVVTIKNGKAVEGKSAYEIAKQYDSSLPGEAEWAAALRVPEFYQGTKKLNKVSWVVEGAKLKITTS
jgi:hypothetical protein